MATHHPDSAEFPEDAMFRVEPVRSGPEYQSVETPDFPENPFYPRSEHQDPYERLGVDRASIPPEIQDFDDWLEVRNREHRPFKVIKRVPVPTENPHYPPEQWMDPFERMGIDPASVPPEIRDMEYWLENQARNHRPGLN
jgi:hypothetical protein